MLVALVVVGLLVADLRFNAMQSTRSVMEVIVAPVYWVADIPSRLADWNEEHLVSRADLLEQNERLRRENLVLNGRSQQMSSLQAENIRLRALLNSTAMLRDDVLAKVGKPAKAAKIELAERDGDPIAAIIKRELGI